MLCRVPTVGQNLKRLRGKMTQEELAEASGVAQGDISKWEKEKALPTIPSVLRLAKALGCSVEQLLAGVDPEYDEIVIGQRDLLRHSHKGDSHPHAGGLSAQSLPITTRIQQLEQQLRERDRFIAQVEDAALKVVRLFTATKENRSARAHESRRRSARRKTG
jgi:transcriptional regulator with XRE-family HTH domain